MSYGEAPPAPALRGWVERWLTSNDGTAPPSEPITVLPDGRASLVITWTPSGAEVLAVGPRTRPFAVWDLEPVEKLEVRLRPEAARAVLGAAASELRDAQTPLAALWGDAALRPLEGLELAGAGERRRAVESWLAARAPTRIAPPELHQCLTILEQSGGRVAIGELVRRLRIGERRLERMFRRHVGMPPKRYARLVRFQRAVAGLRQGMAPASCAAVCGFADQAHLSRETRQLADATPARLIAAR